MAQNQQLISVSSGQYMGVRDSLSNSVPYTRDTNRLILHDGNQAMYQGQLDPRSFQTVGDDRARHASLHSFGTEFQGHQNRKIGQSQVTEAKPVSFYRELEPNKYLNAPDLEGARDVQIIEKTAERLVEVMQLQPVEKPVERLFETIQVQDQQAVHELQLTCVVPEIVEVQKPVHYDREVLKENIQEIYVDKVVERVVEVLREVYVDKVVQRRVEVLKEVPTIRYVDRVITREVPIVQVVERVVEVLKEVPIEVVKEVPVYVRTDVTDVEEHNRNKGQYTQAGASFSQYTGGTQAMVLQQQPMSMQQSSYQSQGGGMQSSSMSMQQSQSAGGNFGMQSSSNGGGMSSSSAGAYGQSSSAGAYGQSSSSSSGSGRAGVGLVLEREQKDSAVVIYVRKLVPGSPAFNNGQIKVDDKLLSINGVDLGAKTLDKVFEMINGPAGSKVSLKLESGNRPYDVDLIRGQAKK